MNSEGLVVLAHDTQVSFANLGHPILGLNSSDGYAGAMVRRDSSLCSE